MICAGNSPWWWVSFRIVHSRQASSCKNSGHERLPRKFGEVRRLLYENKRGSRTHFLADRRLDMTQSNETRKEFVPPTPAALMARYLQKQTEAHANGLAAVDLTGEVQPYEAGPVQ